MKRFALLAGALLSLSAPPVVRAVIFTTGPYSAAAGALESDFNQTATQGAQAIAGSFSLSSPSVVTRVNWWGLYAFGNTPPAQDDFVVRFFADAGGPASLPFSESLNLNPGRTDTGANTAGDEIYAYSALLPASVSLAANTTYWLSIVNYTPTDTDDEWFWQLATKTSGSLRVRYNDAYPWLLSGPGVLAFSFEGTVVPEPSTGALLTGVGGLALLARRGRFPFPGSIRLPGRRPIGAHLCLA